MNRILFGLVALVSASWFVPVQGPAPKVELLTLEIHKPLADGMDAEFRHFKTGTTFRFFLKLPDRHIIDIDKEGSKLTNFTDDKGTDLTSVKKESPFGGMDQLWTTARVSKDAKQCSFEFSAPGVPTIGATRIKLKATIVVLCGANQKTEEAKDILFNNKLKLAIGPFSVSTAVAIGGDDPVMEFQSLHRKHILGVRLLSADGKQLDLPQVGWSGGTVFGKTEYRTIFSLKGAADRNTVRVAYFDQMENVIVPIDLQVGVGF